MHPGFDIFQGLIYALTPADFTGTVCIHAEFNENSKNISLIQILCNIKVSLFVYFLEKASYIAL